MKKIFASQARFLCDATPNKDVHGTHKMSKVIYDTFSGYVHAFYPHVMELYEGGTERFRMDGMQDTPRVSEMAGHLASCALRAINTIAQLATGLSLLSLRKELIECRDRFMKSEVYKSGNTEK